MDMAIPRRSARAGAGASGLYDPPSLLCPICAEDLFEGEEIRQRPCPHVPLVGRPGTLYCFDRRMERMVIDAWKSSAGSGARTLDVLRERLHPGFLVVELLDAAPGEGGPVTVVVDLRGEWPA